MDIGVGKGGAVRRDQQIRTLKERRVGRHQFDLHRPVGKGRSAAAERETGLFASSQVTGLAKLCIWDEGQPPAA